MQTMLRCLDNVAQYLKKAPKRHLSEGAWDTYLQRYSLKGVLINSESVRVLVGSFIKGEGASAVLLQISCNIIKHHQSSFACLVLTGLLLLVVPAPGIVQTRTNRGRVWASRRSRRPPGWGGSGRCTLNTTTSPSPETRPAAGAGG